MTNNRRILLLGAGSLLALTACGRAPQQAAREPMLSNVLISTSTSNNLTGFIVYRRWMGAGFGGVTYAEFARNPRIWHRSDAAYDLNIRVLGLILGRSLSAAEYDQIIRGQDPSAVITLGDCPRRFYTTGVDAEGKVAWFTRARYDGEQCLKVNGQPFISLGCLNPIDGPIARPAPKHRMDVGDDDPRRSGNPPEQPHNPEEPNPEEPHVPEEPEKPHEPEQECRGKCNGNNGLGNGGEATQGEVDSGATGQGGLAEGDPSNPGQGGGRAHSGATGGGNGLGRDKAPGQNR